MQSEHTKKMDGLVAIVTGASRGLGRAIAKEFAGEGAKVVVSARRNRRVARADQFMPVMYGGSNESYCSDSAKT